MAPFSSPTSQPILTLWGPCQLGLSSFSSENNTPRTHKSTFQLELPVKYAVYTVISRYPIWDHKELFFITLFGAKGWSSLPAVAEHLGYFRFYCHSFLSSVGDTASWVYSSVSVYCGPTMIIRIVRSLSLYSTFNIDCCSQKACDNPKILLG